MVHDIGSDVGKKFGHGKWVKKIGTISAINADHGVALAQKMRAEMPSDESGCTSYKSPHGVTLGPRCTREFEQ